VEKPFAIDVAIIGSQLRNLGISSQSEFATHAR
jgi:hypothetical protein